MALAGPGQRVADQGLLGPVGYLGAGQAFCWPGTAAFNQAARDDAGARILAMLAS